MLPIYTITTIPHDYPYKDSRCIGWFESCKVAFDHIKVNAGDMNEDGRYRFIVIEEVEEGLYTFPRKEFWFEWFGVDEKYIILKDKPNRFNNVVCFSMG